MHSTCNLKKAKTRVAARKRRTGRVGVGGEGWVWGSWGLGVGVRRVGVPDRDTTLLPTLPHLPFPNTLSTHLLHPPHLPILSLTPYTLPTPPYTPTHFPYFPPHPSTVPHSFHISPILDPTIKNCPTIYTPPCSPYSSP